MKITKALIPVAGLGTRFLPATKTVPKELFPIVDQPLLLYVMKEALDAGIEEFVFVTNDDKPAILDFFKPSAHLENHLRATQKEDLLKILEDLPKISMIKTAPQKKPQGLGHAVLCGKNMIGSEDFAVMLPDEIMMGKSVIRELIDVYQKMNLSTVAVMQVPKTDVSKYGIVKGEPFKNGLQKVTFVVEKPSVQSAPSQFALPGRYVFSNRIFNYLSEVHPGKNGEIQLTDAMTLLAQNEGLLATTFSAKRFDAGDKAGFVIANIEWGLQHREVAAPLRAYLQTKIGDL